MVERPHLTHVEVVPASVVDPSVVAVVAMAAGWMAVGVQELPLSVMVAVAMAADFDYWEGVVEHRNLKVIKKLYLCKYPFMQILVFK